MEYAVILLVMVSLIFLLVVTVPEDNEDDWFDGDWHDSDWYRK